MDTAPLEEPRFIHGGRVEAPVVTGLEGPVWWQLLASEAFREAVKRRMATRAFPVHQSAAASLAAASKKTAALAAEYFTAVYLGRVRADPHRTRVRDVLQAAKDVVDSCEVDPADYPSFLRFATHGRLKAALLECEKGDVDVFNHTRVQRWLGLYWDALPKRSVAVGAARVDGGAVKPARRRTRLAGFKGECGGGDGGDDESAGRRNGGGGTVPCVTRATFTRLHIVFHWFVLFAARAPFPGAGDEEDDGDNVDIEDDLVRQRWRDAATKARRHHDFNFASTTYSFADVDFRDHSGTAAEGACWWRKDGARPKQQAPPGSTAPGVRAAVPASGGGAQHSQRRADQQAERRQATAAYRAVGTQPVPFSFQITNQELEASERLADRDYDMHAGGPDGPKMLTKAAFFDVWYRVVEGWCEAHDPGEVSELLRAASEALQHDRVLSGGVPDDYRHVYGTPPATRVEMRSPHKFYHIPPVQPKKGGTEVDEPPMSPDVTCGRQGWSPNTAASGGAPAAAPIIVEPTRSLASDSLPTFSSTLLDANSPLSPVPPCSPFDMRTPASPLQGKDVRKSWSTLVGTPVSPHMHASVSSGGSRPMTAPPKQPLFRVIKVGEQGAKIDRYIKNLHKKLDGRYTPTPLLVSGELYSSAVGTGVAGFQPPARSSKRVGGLPADKLRRLEAESGERLDAFLDVPGARPFPPPASLRMPDAAGDGDALSLSDGAPASPPQSPGSVASPASPPLRYTPQRETLLGMHQEAAHEVEDGWVRGTMAKLAAERAQHRAAEQQLHRYDILAVPSPTPRPTRVDASLPPPPKAAKRNAFDLERVVMERTAERLNTQGAGASTTLLQYISDDTIDRGALDSMRRAAGGVLDSFSTSVTSSRATGRGSPVVSGARGEAAEGVPASPDLGLSRHPAREVKREEEALPKDDEPHVNGVAVASAALRAGQSSPRGTAARVVGRTPSPGPQTSQVRHGHHSFPPRVSSFLKVARNRPRRVRQRQQEQQSTGRTRNPAPRGAKAAPAAQHIWPESTAASSPVAPPSVGQQGRPPVHRPRQLPL